MGSGLNSRSQFMVQFHVVLFFVWQNAILVSGIQIIESIFTVPFRVDRQTGGLTANLTTDRFKICYHISVSEQIIF